MKARSPATGPAAGLRASDAARIAAHWHGVRMRKVRAGADPDAATRLVTLPVDWEDSAAAALAQLAPGRADVSLAQAATRWIVALDDGARTEDRQAADAPGGSRTAGPDLAGRLATMLLHRIAAPNQAVWQGSRTASPAFVLNLAAFARPGSGFDLNGFAAAIGAVSDALRLLLRAGGRSGRILLGNLDACLAALGLDYDSDPARDVAACLVALATTSAHPERVPAHGAGQPPPSRCVIPMLARRANAAWQQAAAQASDRSPELFREAGPIETGLSAPGPADALLGFEACGIAPIFSPLRADGRLAASTLARLAARRMSPEAALAASLAGEVVLRTADFASVQAMHRAVSPFIDRMLAPMPAHQPVPVSTDDRVAVVPPTRRELPSRHGGFTQKASVGGHRLYLRTGEYADGSLGELAISPVRDGPAQRGLMEAFAQAVSLGLQHGVPLEAYVEAFAYTRFGPNGAVEGDASISSATSLLDYAFRTLAHAYLGRALPDAPRQTEANRMPLDAAADALLPLDLPRAADAEARPGIKPGVRQRHGLRLVG